MDEQNQNGMVDPKVETVVPAPVVAETSENVAVEVAPVPVAVTPESITVEVRPFTTSPVIGPASEVPGEDVEDADFPVATPKPKKTRKPRTKKVVKTKAKGKTKTKKSKLGRGHKICSHCGKPNGPRAFTCKHCGRKFKMNVEPKNRTIKTKKVRKNRKSKK